MCAIKSWPKSERPRETLFLKGSSVLSDAELLAILLRNGSRGKDAVALARELLVQFGSLRNLLQTEPKTLLSIRGIGQAKAAQILAACEISNRRLKEHAKNSVNINNPRAVYDYLTTTLRDRKDELYIGVFLNKKNNVIDVVEFDSGAVDRVNLNIRKIVGECIALGAARFILAHNHPSGSMEPGNKDLQLTAKMRDGLKFIEVDFMDHIIISKEGFYSMKEHGELIAV